MSLFRSIHGSTTPPFAEYFSGTTLTSDDLEKIVKLDLSTDSNFTLPSITGNDLRQVFFKLTGSGIAEFFTDDPSVTVDGLTSFQLPSGNSAVRLVVDEANSQYHILSTYFGSLTEASSSSSNSSSSNSSFSSSSTEILETSTSLSSSSTSESTSSSTSESTSSSTSVSSSTINLSTSSDSSSSTVSTSSSSTINFSTSSPSSSQEFSSFTSSSSSSPSSSQEFSSFTSSSSVLQEFAAQFTAASNERLNSADNASLSMGDIDFTMAIWVYMDTVDTIRYAMTKFNDNSASEEYQIGFSSATSVFTFTVSSDGTIGTRTSLNISATGMVIDTWYLLTVWHDSTNNLIGGQINDDRARTTAHSGGVFDGNSDFLIGGNQPGGSFGNPWNGRLALAGIWKNRILTESERNQLFNFGNGFSYSQLPSGLLTNLESYWNLDESSGTRFDSVGSNDLTDVNTVTQAVGPRATLDSSFSSSSSSNSSSTINMSTSSTTESTTSESTSSTINMSTSSQSTSSSSTAIFSTSSSLEFSSFSSSSSSSEKGGFNNPIIDQYEQYLSQVWKLGEASGTRNNSITPNHLSEFGTTSNRAGKDGNAYSGDGTVAAAVDRVQASNSSDLELSDDMYISSWILLDDTGAGSTGHPAWEFGNGTSTAFSIALAWQDGGGQQLRVFLNDSVGLKTSSSFTISVSTWYHVGIALLSTGVMKIYINGVLHDTVIYSAPIDQHGADSSVSVGCALGGTGIEWDGGIDELYVWKGIGLSIADALTLSEDLYNSGTGRFYSVAQVSSSSTS